MDKGIAAVRLTFELPILVRGRPKSSKSVIDVYCSTSYLGDIPEVSLLEMPVVFEVSTRGGKLPNNRLKVHEINDRIEAKVAEMETPYRLRTFEGRYYRKIAGSVKEASRLGLFGTPFDLQLSGRLDSHMPTSRNPAPGWLAEYGGDISPVQVVRGNPPIAGPLKDEFEWQLDRRSTLSLKSKLAWPKPGPRGDNLNAGWHSHRNQVRLDGASAQIKEIDGHDLDVAMSLIRTQVDRLIVADGEIWMASRPPAYRVQFMPGFTNGPPSQIVVAMVTAPESYVGDLNTLHFSLADEEQAMSAAGRYYGNDGEWRDGHSRTLMDFRVPYECADETLLDYDYQQEEINRVGYTAAVECHAFLARKPDYAAKLSADQIETIGQAYAATLETNYLLDRHADMSPFIPTLASSWKRLGYKQILTGGHGLSYQAETALARALDHIDNAPINLRVDAPSFAPRRLGMTPA